MNASRRMPSRLVGTLACLVSLVPSPSEARPAARQWVTGWSAAPQPPLAAGGPLPASPSFGDQTLVQIVRLTAPGARIRLRLTNAFGTNPLAIGRVTVGVATADGAFVSGTERTVTFSGLDQMSVPAGTPLVSDPIELAADAGTLVGIRIHLPEATGPCTCHMTALQGGWVLAGNRTTSVSAPGMAANLSGGRAFIAAVDVEAPRSGATIAVLGDSLADGMGSSENANHRWPDFLSQRLSSRGGAVRGIANLGISGNRLLAPGAGESALARFDRDVLSQPGVRYLVVSIGINDIGASQLGKKSGPIVDLLRSMFPDAGVINPETLIAGYRQLIARAHARGIMVYGATLTPFGGAILHTPAAEEMRQAVNSWIRTSNEFDAVIDFDAVWRDPARHAFIREEYQSGDMLHGNDAGYRALAESIDLELFE
jgi:lysophospholipase L1-like esterase